MSLNLTCDRRNWVVVNKDYRETKWYSNWDKQSWWKRADHTTTTTTTIIVALIKSWIGECYHTELWTVVFCAMSLSLGDVKLFFGPKHNIYTLFMILFWFIWFDTIICLSNLSCELWNRKKRKYFKKWKNHLLRLRGLTPTNLSFRKTMGSWIRLWLNDVEFWIQFNQTFLLQITMP